MKQSKPALAVALVFALVAIIGFVVLQPWMGIIGLIAVIAAVVVGRPQRFVLASDPVTTEAPRRGARERIRVVPDDRRRVEPTPEREVVAHQRVQEPVRETVVEEPAEGEVREIPAEEAAVAAPDKEVVSTGEPEEVHPEHPAETTEVVIPPGVDAATLTGALTAEQMQAAAEEAEEEEEAEQAGQ